MRLEGIVVNLELAKELKASSYPQETNFYWNDIAQKVTVKPILMPAEELDFIEAHSTEDFKRTLGKGVFAAPIASEIGEHLPTTISGLDYMAITMERRNGKHVVRYPSTNNELREIRFEDETEANARAKMWLFLKQENLLLEQSQE